MMSTFKHLRIIPVLALLAGCASTSSAPPSAPPQPPSAPPAFPSTPGNEDGKEQTSSKPRHGEATSPSAEEPATGPVAQSGKDDATEPQAEASETAEDKTASGTQAMTEEEREQEWNESFDVALGEFDRRIARERIEIEQQQQAESGEDGKDSEDEPNGSGLGGQGAIPSEDAGDDDIAAIGSGGPGGRGQPHAGPKFPAPAGTPDGKDDDVVARQLREAAETEQDPELRKRLWEEYRKYKSQS